MYERPVLILHSRSWQDFDALGKKLVFPVEFYPNGGFAKGDSHHCPAVFLELPLSVFTFIIFFPLGVTLSIGEAGFTNLFK